MVLIRVVISRCCDSSKCGFQRRPTPLTPLWPFGHLLDLCSLATSPAPQFSPPSLNIQATRTRYSSSLIEVRSWSSDDTLDEGHPRPRTTTMKKPGGSSKNANSVQIVKCKSLCWAGKIREPTLVDGSLDSQLSHVAVRVLKPLEAVPAPSAHRQSDVLGVSMTKFRHRDFLSKPMLNDSWNRWLCRPRF